MWFYSPSTRGFYREGREDIPLDAEQVSDQLRHDLLVAEQEGKMITPSPNGHPIAIDPPQITFVDSVKMKITNLESQQTPRRIREALLGIDDGWLANIELQIKTLRDSLQC